MKIIQGTTFALISLVFTAAAQTQSACDQAIAQVVPRRIADRDTARAKGELTARASELTRDVQNDLASAEMRAACLSEAFDKQIAAIIEVRRIDKQVGAGGGSSGSTSATSSGSVPALLGIGLESGAVTKTISGTAATYRTAPAKLISALAKQYAWQVADDDPGMKFLKKVSTAVVFNTGSTGSATTTSTPSSSTSKPPAGAASVLTTLSAQFQQISEFSVRVELKNDRDVFSNASYKRIQALRTMGGDKSLALADRFLGEIGPDSPALIEGPGDPDKWDAEKLTERYQSYFAGLKQRLANNPRYEEALKAYVAAWQKADAAEKKIYSQIAKSQIWTLEYTWQRPGAVTADTTPAAASTATAADSSTVTPPNLHTARLINANRFIGQSEYTVNFSSTWFAHALPSMRGMWRDAQVSAKLDIPLPEILGSKPTFTLSGLYMHLHQKPLGLDLKVNDVKINQPGNLGLFQARYAIPLGDTGVSIPISLTVSNRTELVKESEVRGNIGMTFDLDKLFAKNQAK